jgi:hypothetical protein
MLIYEKGEQYIEITGGDRLIEGATAVQRHHHYQLDHVMMGLIATCWADCLLAYYTEFALYEHHIWFTSLASIYIFLFIRKF